MFESKRRRNIKRKGVRTSTFIESAKICHSSGGSYANSIALAILPIAYVNIARVSVSVHSMPTSVVVFKHSIVEVSILEVVSPGSVLLSSPPEASVTSVIVSNINSEAFVKTV